MKTVVCYGDSNTWGYMPKVIQPALDSMNRYPWGVRWTSVLQELLGSEYRVEENGLNGRTSFFECPFGPHRNGLAELDAYMLSKMPVDLVVIMLGTNDTKDVFSPDSYVSARGIGRIVQLLQKSDYGLDGKGPEMLICTPIRMLDCMKSGWLAGEFGKGALAVDAGLAVEYEKLAKAAGVHFIDIGAHVTADPADGIHMNEAGHRKVAELLNEKIRSILG